ncbi:hypothetical protein MSG28_015126 [Choristoneura fumiferana]|uniref:Uncharacterized protein n=1 Tax=Choristoneura fumiferana TaxID=7141 RepID=A0ACC0KYZ4_CHOFU|nr:hypothetical protein MSG28_015126 [Choristoneura fumiferana]
MGEWERDSAMTAATGYGPLEPPAMSQPPSKVIHLPKVRMLRGRAAGGIRITNVKSIKPPDPQMVKQQEENKLRAQLVTLRSARALFVTTGHDPRPLSCVLPLTHPHAKLEPPAMSQPPSKVIHLPKVRMLRGRAAGGIRITNVKSIKPPDPQMVKQQEENKLRAQLQKEIVSRSRTCQNKTYECHLPVVTGRQFCAQHILQDPSAPYRQCVYASGSGARCPLPAPADARDQRDPGRYASPYPLICPPKICWLANLNLLDATVGQTTKKTENRSIGTTKCRPTWRLWHDFQLSWFADCVEKVKQLCYTHARAALQSRARSAAPPPPVASSETLLHQLNHYVRPERPRTSSCASSVSVVSDPAEPEPTAPDPVDPFTQIDAPAVNAAYSAAIMECGSASDSDADSVCLPPACSGPQADEDAPTDRAPLWRCNRSNWRSMGEAYYVQKRAGVYTAEEAVSEAKTALRSLQAAYIKQMGRLRVLLQMARLKYLRDLKAEKEQYCSINAQARGAPTTARERRQLRKLKAYAGYHRRHGVDAVLARKLQRKRAKVNDPVQNRPVPAQARCTFQEGSARCAAHAVPAAKHCLAHILHDKQQVLFVPCNDPRGLSPCRVPLPRLPPPAAGCRYHAMPPPYCVFTLKKDDSESEASVASDASHERPIGAL